MGKIKQLMWNVLTPAWPYLRDTATWLGLARHRGRQPYHLGWLAPGKSIEDFRVFLQGEGFDEDKIAWVDDGETIDLRLRENFKYQFHLRVFNDGEVRGHHELTPEYSAFAHLGEKDFSEQRDQFMSLLGDWVTSRIVH